MGILNRQSWNSCLEKACSFLKSREIWYAVAAAIIIAIIFGIVTFMKSCGKELLPSSTKPPKEVQPPPKIPLKFEPIDFPHFQNKIEEHRNEQRVYLAQPEVRRQLLEALAKGVYGVLESAPLPENSNDLNDETLRECAGQIFSAYKKIMQKDDIDTPKNLEGYHAPADCNHPLPSWVEFMEDEIFLRFVDLVVYPQVKRHGPLLRKGAEEIQRMKSRLALSDGERESEKRRILGEIKVEMGKIVADPNGYYLFDYAQNVLDTTVRLLWKKEHEKKQELSDEERRSAIDGILKDLSGSNADG